MLKIRFFYFSFLLQTIFLYCLPRFSHSQNQRQENAAEIKLKLNKLNFLGSVLYVAAHPDDENTRIIAFLGKEKLASVAYLSMTRGDGGQNLIGPEIRDELGVIRTQELLAARRIDGGQQFFTRAIDFGYSKTAKETFQFWNQDSILTDVVKIYSQFQPDVIITRFPPDERAGHGHHTASAILANDAFSLITKSNTGTLEWKPKRLFTNTGRWWNKTINENSSGVTTVNVGEYNRLLGLSYTEMAATSRTLHKSQGFGSSGKRGEELEFLEFTNGDSAKNDIFDGVNTTWKRIKGGEKIIPLVDKAIKEYNPEKPELSVPQLLIIRNEISKLPASLWKERKLVETEELIFSCTGFFVEALSNRYYCVDGEDLTVSFELINRSNVDMTCETVHSSLVKFDSTLNTTLSSNQLFTFKLNKKLIADNLFSTPYWLKNEHPIGSFNVSDKKLIGMAENPPAIVFELKLKVMGEIIMLKIPLQYKWNDPVKGELHRPVEITPPVFLNFSNSVFIFSDSKPKSIDVLVKSASENNLVAKVSLLVEKGWRIEPAFKEVTLEKFGSEQIVSFIVYPPDIENQSFMKAEAEVNGKKYAYSLESIQYDHIPIQTILPLAQVNTIRLNIKKEGNVIGYIAGAGDGIANSLRNIGYEVWEMKNEEVTLDNLKKVDAVVLGVRSLNVNDRIRYFMPDLLQYVNEGGTMVVQYNTSQNLGIDEDKFSPYPMKLSRDRVSEENSTIKVLIPNHIVLTTPNKISASDFDNWVQERGLYYPSEWDNHYEAILSGHDEGETDKNGGLLVAKFEKGYYVYTSLSFFRQLPEGVIGAYKLFANIVSIGKSSKLPENKKGKK